MVKTLKLSKKQKKILILSALLLFTLASTSAIYWHETRPEPVSELEQNQINPLGFVPDVWTPEVKAIYNESDPIDFLEYVPYNNIIINNETKRFDKFVIVLIPDYMENRALVKSYNYTKTWNDDNVILGNKTKTFEIYSEAVYVFADVNVSIALYDQCKLYHPGLSYVEVKVLRANVSRLSYEEPGFFNTIPTQLR